MADAPPTRRRRLMYMEKGGSSSIPKSTLCRMRKEGLSGLGSLGSSQDSGDAASDACDVGSSGHDTSVGHISESDIASDELELSDVDVESTSFPSAEPSGGDPRAGAATATDALTSALREFGREGLPHSCTTKGEAVAMVMSLMVAGGLSWADLDNLLVVINTMFAPAADVLPRSKYLFRKLWTKQTDALIQYHFYCTCCCDRMTGTPDSEELTCQTCSHRTSARQLKNEGAFFVTLNMHDQLQHVITKTKTFLQDALTKVPPPPGDISDVTEGRACREMRSSGTLNNDDVTLTVNTDGSPVFSSSGASVWPIQFLVNELPAPERFKHCTLAGLWFGKGHPNMALFLEQFVDGLNSMDPVVWEQDGLSHASRAYILCWCLDAPARAAVQNCTLFNGYIGCPWCLTRGEHLDGSMRYTNLEDTTPRTSAGVLRDMKLALSLGGTFPVNGYFGPSPAVNLPHFNLVWGFTVEYMHAVLLGVVRQITELLLSSSNSQERYYVGNTASLAVINSRLAEIKPPHSFTRLPRALSTRTFWKASEWRHWLLYYWLPCMYGVLLDQYWLHIKKLVEAIHALLRDTVTPASIDVAEKLLWTFVGMTGRLYGAAAMTFNLHQLLHLAEAVRQLGPLWGHSAFEFESGNGQLVKLVKGSNAVPCQIVERVVMSQQLDQTLASSLLSDSVKVMCCDILGYPKLQNFKYANEVCLLGYSSKASLSDEEKSCLSAGSGASFDQAAEYKRFAWKGQIFHSRNYARSKKTDSSVIQTKDMCYFSILRVLCLKGEVTLLCREVVITCAGPFPQHIKPCFLSHVNLQAVKPQQLKAPCLFLTFRQPSVSYVCDLPNLLERD